MKKNLLAKVTLALLVCASIIPAAASSHYKTLKLSKSNATLGAGQQVTDLGYQKRRGHQKHIAVLFRKLENTQKVDLRVLDSAKNVILDWDDYGRDTVWNGTSLHPVDGVSIGKGSYIDFQLRDHYMHKKDAAVLDGEIDYND